jgi:hypothetical protein
MAVLLRGHCMVRRVLDVPPWTPSCLSRAFVFSLPMVSLLREGAAVTLGDFGPGWLECRFKSPKYAEAFASVNHAMAQNAENIREELEAGIQSIQTVATGGETNV